MRLSAMTKVASSGRSSINREQPISVSQGVLIGLLIVAAAISPIAHYVATDKVHRVLICVG